jgi:hypothetical protein
LSTTFANDLCCLVTRLSAVFALSNMFPTEVSRFSSVSAATSWLAPAMD